MEPASVVTGVVALVLGVIPVTLSTATGNQEKLCDAMGGTYQPSYTENLCPDGTWSNLLWKPVPVPQEAG